MGEGIPHSQRKGVRVIPHSQGFRYAASLPACGGALQSGIKKAQSSKLVALFCYHFAVSEGFEPPVRSHVHLFSRQAPSTTRTTHRRRTAKVEIISELSKKPPQSSSSFCHNLLEQMAMSSSWVRVMEECRPVSSKKRSGLRPMVSGQPL